MIIGAGGMVFPLTLAADLLATPELHHCELVLMDLSLKRAERTLNAVQELCEHHQIQLQVSATDNQKEALQGAKYIFLTFQVGGIEAYRMDIEIPRAYGIDCVAGDTMNPGGIMRFLRSMNAFDQIAADVLEICPDALVLNYANPMAMNVMYLSHLGLDVVGLCHSIPGTAQVIADFLGMDAQLLAYQAAGINHQAFFLKLEVEGRDMQDDLREVLRKQFLPSYGGTTPWTEGGPTYVGGQERVRAELMETFGYFISESSHHVSEYVPYFRQEVFELKSHLVRRWDYLKGSLQVAGKEQEMTRGALENLKQNLCPSHEYGIKIIAAMESGTETTVYANVMNDGLIPNLPDDACVEVPCKVTSGGLLPVAVGKIPPQCAGLNLTNIALQRTIVDAVIEQDARAVRAGFALDPLTASVLDLPAIRQLAEDLLHAQGKWLPGWLQESRRLRAPHLPGPRQYKSFCLLPSSK
ncbi:family 4 glycosyl hydrolase [Deinococcus cellulosilyticus]|uniref:family 4 glycosyl hydrolase n=1 Tax=Deinococcus cellulosilyticus TaxID=401558 RepID=UPI002482779B|nr:hypothetical protein [Deinococcus cellulosilyticus]